MALTKISTGGVKDDAASQAIIADEAVDEARLQISNAGSNGQFLQKTGNTGGLTWAAANEYTHPNHSGEVTSTADGAQVIADNIVDEANLKVDNSPTNDHVLTAKSSASGGLTWAAPAAGGNTFTAVANGSIANNKCVKLDTDGKVSEVKQILSPRTPIYAGAFQNPNSNEDFRFSKVVYDPDTDRVVMFHGIGSSPNMKQISYHIKDSNTELEDRIEGNVESTQTVANDGQQNFDWDVVYDTSLNKFLYVYSSGNDNKIRSKYGTYNTSTKVVDFAMGHSNATYVGGNYEGSHPVLHYDATTNRYVCLYRNDWTNKINVVVGNWGGSAIAWGTPIEISSFTGYSTYSWNRICSFGNGKCLIGYYNSASTGSYVGRILTISTSSNTATYTNEQNLSGSNTSHSQPILIYNEADDNAILLATTPSDNNPYARRISMNSGGTGFDASAHAHLFNYSGSYGQTNVNGMTATYNKSSGKINIWMTSNSTGNLTATYVSNTSGTPTLANHAATTFNVQNSYLGFGESGPASDAGICKDYFGYERRDSYNTGLLLASHTITVSSNIDSAEHRKYVGYADQAYTNGQTATIKTYGNTVDTLSGLTIGANYFVQTDGTVGTSKDEHFTYSNTPLAGLALTASKLLIRDPSYSAYP